MITNKKKFIITALSIAAINILAIVAWWYVFDIVRAEKQNIKKTFLQINANEKRLDNVRSLNNLLKNIQKENEKISAIFLNSKNIVTFIEELEYLSRETGTALEIKSAQIPEKGQTEKPHFSLEAKGTFRDLFQYLTILENVPYQIEINRASFSKLEKEEWQVNFEITLESYENI